MVNEAEIPSQDVVEVVVSPPYVFLGLVQTTLRTNIHVAAQNCWVNEGGDFTGEISAEMLVNMSIPWVILGHSERRLSLNESNEFVGEKVAYALSKGLKVIVCVGETLAQMESGSTMDVVIAQTKAIAGHVADWADVVLAYEPVWAIETGKVVSPAQAQEVHSELRHWLKGNTSTELYSNIRIIYGGPVNGDYCKELARKPDIDGFLVNEVCREPGFLDIINSVKVEKDLTFNLEVKELMFSDVKITNQGWNERNHIRFLELYHTHSGVDNMEEVIQYEFPDNAPQFISFIIRIHDLAKSYAPLTIVPPVPPTQVPPLQVPPLQVTHRRNWTVAEYTKLYYLVNQYDASIPLPQRYNKWRLISALMDSRACGACQARYPKINVPDCIARNDNEVIYREMVDGALAIENANALAESNRVAREA